MGRLINGKTRREQNESAQPPINGHAYGQRRLRLRVTPGRTRAEHIKSASPPRSGHLADMPGRPLGATSGPSDPNYEQKKSPAVVGWALVQRLMAASTTIFTATSGSGSFDFPGRVVRD